jgi:hypothetical protein
MRNWMTWIQARRTEDSALKGAPRIRSFTHLNKVILVITSAVIFWGCYPKAVGPVSPNGERLTWAEMTLAQRKAHMDDEILPRAADLFGEWRPDRYADVDCGLCHGRGVETDDFGMPTDHLPRLSGDLLLGTEFSKHPETTRLKLDRLVPMMAEALGVKSFSIITRRGFGCYSCHLGPDGPMFGN